MVVPLAKMAETTGEASLREENQEFSFESEMPIGYLSGNVK